MHTEEEKDGGAPVFYPPLYKQRYDFVRRTICEKLPDVSTVADFGCAEGSFIRYLKKIPTLKKLCAIDLDSWCLSECDYEGKARPSAWECKYYRIGSSTIFTFDRFEWS